MAEISNDGGKVQIVFLVDVFFKQLGVKPLELEEICQLRCKAISLCVLRLLLHFNASVGYSDRKKSLSWGFKFFNSRILNFECKRRRFYDLDSHSFEKFEEELKERSENVCNSRETGSKSSKQSCNGAKALSCSFTEILHDFSWITPDISSPFRNGKDNHLNDVVRNPRNLLFVIGDCPQDNRDLQCFLGQKEIYNEGVLMKEIFSQALYEEFRNTCNLSLFWIDTGLWCLAPEKMGVLKKEWDGYKLMTAITRQLNGNMIPISSLTQDGMLCGNPLNCVSLQQNLKPSGAVTSKPCDETCESSNQPELYNRVLQAKFGISFRGVVEAFLSGKDLTGMDVVSCALLSVPSRGEGLFHGFLYFKGDEKICHIQLTQMITENRKDSSVANASQQPHSLMVNISKKSSFISEKSPLPATQNEDSVDDPSTPCHSRKSTDFCIKMDEKSENFDATVQDTENAFFIKGVISRGSVPPSWLHPTKLFSCLEWGKHPPSADDSAVSEALCSSGLLQKLLLLISSKGLNLVVEFHDPETCVPLIGLLQPVTSVCAILSVVKTEMLLTIEKLLLSQKSRGCTLVSRDVTVVSCDVTTNDDTNTPTLPVEVRENIQLSSSGLHNDLVLKGVPSNQSAAKASSHLHKNNMNEHLNEKIVHTFIHDIGCKQQSKRKDGKELLLKLRDYYSKKQGRQTHERNKESTVNQPLTRGRLCQDTSRKNKATINQESKVESNSKPREWEEPDDHVISSGLDSEMTDAMEIDEKLPNLSDISTVDDFKAYLEEGYQKCVNLVHPAVVFVTHAFIIMDRLKSSGELKDMNDIMTVLKSCVLRDNQNLREMIEKRGDLADKDKIVQEYKLQVYLRLELANKIEGVDQESLADEITEMLRAISFQKHPTYLSLFLKNSVITRYAGNLSKLLCHVYDGLMLRPPTEILSPSQISSEEDTPLKSCKVSSVSSKSESVEETKNTRTLGRRHSVMGVPDRRREIVVPVKVKPAKNSEKGTRSTSSARKQSSSKASGTKKSVTPVKKVRRNLFMRNADGDARRTSPRKAHKISAPRTEKDKLSRRHSFASFSRSKKVADTPVCKQVSKRMLRRQEWARRAAKTVTDVTVIGESPLKDEEVVRPFPRKSPRRRAATFYSISSHTSLASKSTTTSISKAPEQSSEENNGTTSFSSSTTEDVAVDGESSSRQRLQRSLSNTKPASTVSNNAQIDESFVEVFMDTEEATSQTVVSTQSSGDPKKSPLPPPRIPFTSHPVPSVTVLTRRSKSSPSLSQSSPASSRVSPSNPKRPLNASTSFPSTSPFCKSQSSGYSSEQIFGIAIPLTPVKIDHIKSLNFGSITTDISPRRCPTSVEKRCYSTATSHEGIARGQCSPSPGVKHPSGDRSARLGQPKPGNLQTNNDDSDSDSVVVASPRLDRKRSLLSGAEPSSAKTILSCLKNVEVFKKDEFLDDSTGKGTTTDETNDGCPTVSGGDRQRTGYKTIKLNSDPDPRGDLEQSEVFTSPVATRPKRLTLKRERTSGSVSPLNQILKQRKNHRTPPGSSREAVSKPEKEPSAGKNHRLKSTSMDTDDSSLYPETKGEINLVKFKRPLLKESDEYEEDKESVEDAHTFHNSSRTDAPTDYSSDEAMSSEKTTSPSSHSARNRHYSRPTSQSCSLLPHFTPTALSAWSLKHLEQSPVLFHSSQSPDCPASSFARKWSERSSPRDTARLSLRKRLRHDS